MQFVTNEKYRSEVEEKIEQSITRSKVARLKPRPNHESAVAVAMRDAVSDYFDTSLSPSLTQESPWSSIGSIVRPPKNIPMAWRPDCAIPMFELAKIMHQSPMVLAANCADALHKEKDLFSRVEATGPYVNLQLNDAFLMQSIHNIVNVKDDYGRLADNVGKVAIVEYSSPNVAKPFGINHLRSTVIGEALARLFDASGYTVIRDNHLGDWGTQFGNLLAAHHEYTPERSFASLSMDELSALYVRFSEEKKLSPRLIRLGQSFFARLEAGEPLLLDNWAAALKVSTGEFTSMYKRLGVTFDTQIGEAYYAQAAKKLIDDLSKQDLSGVVEFDPQTKAAYINAEHPVVLRTQDGYCIYGARDLATIQFRQHTYSPDLVAYVVGEEQQTYFRAVFDLAARAGLTKRPDGSNTLLEHINFGLLLDEKGKKLSTRKGTSGKLEDVIDALDRRAIEETHKRNPEMGAQEVSEIAQRVALAALIWNDLRTDRTTSVRFDIAHMLELGKGSVIDVLYSYSRTQSILGKLGISEKTPLDDKLPKTFSTEIEHRLAVQLNELGDIIRKAAEMRAPHVLVGYLQELCQLHGGFYEESRVSGISDPALANMRIAMHRAYGIVVRNSLRLLNIPVTERL